MTTITRLVRCTLCGGTGRKWSLRKEEFYPCPAGCSHGVIIISKTKVGKKRIKDSIEKEDKVKPLRSEGEENRNLM